MLVVDASTLVGAHLPDEPELDLWGLVEPYEEVEAPWLLWAEVRNTLLTLERRGRITADFTERTLSAISGYHIVLDQMPRSAAVLMLARKHRLSVHDALYLELALHREADLATGDRVLADAACAEGVRVVGMP